MGTGPGDGRTGDWARGWGLGTGDGDPGTGAEDGVYRGRGLGGEAGDGAAGTGDRAPARLEMIMPGGYRSNDGAVCLSLL